MQRKHTTHVLFFKNYLKIYFSCLKDGTKMNYGKVMQEKTSGETRTVKQKYINIILMTIDYNTKFDVTK